jgi:hypothetical protein
MCQLYLREIKAGIAAGSIFLVTLIIAGDHPARAAPT